ncbi:carbonic anhydrase/acetyltransferase-like protein (isoleucine patch superfamily) [Chromobacterium alkanivorans]|uniref:gamma carbonic anhydrase family protein n=1 Tax=Chromobacterium alkanivorans TaxID=1071719 RepID=UPI00216952C1|nr:gamma carbonic anhydrase family protein [Chromobacterium alkanivorans]MCS3802810.1 carbonic anhydrase/acetyltransferase-like protein (isoleucine patch superfamily) [Chromobacterium alkanivorans]MCS3817136.1 carbonic anhydrase/acetyltransferase-like protein (isoleucine patch superfamily) [Chromobacterium alkanivorans]MCS3872176.1 carbonic anhydrase/acetyltransferase-like protein (isoleucine patch superfamily) [Chromobacterium alkanivorans]
MKSNIRPYDGHQPQIHDSCYIDPAAVVIGEVSLAEGASVWPYAVIRGDVNAISIGENSNIQDFAMLHVSHKSAADPDGAPLVIGRNVTIGHHVTLHGCTIGDEVLVGIGSIVLDRAVIEPRVLIGAGSLVPPGKRLESGYLYLGNPVKQARPLTEKELAHFQYSAEHYLRVAAKHKPNLED